MRQMVAVVVVVAAAAKSRMFDGACSVCLLFSLGAAVAAWNDA